jgi:hypothetical protein
MTCSLPVRLLLPLVLLLAGATARAAPVAKFSATPVQGPVCVAPCAVHFDAIGDGRSETTDGSLPLPFHSLLFSWAFHDLNGGAWTTSERSKTTAIGAVAGHVYETPGSYRVDLKVVNPAGETSRVNGVARVVVADPNQVFGPTDTFCIANGGTPGGAGFEACPVRGASQHLVVDAFEIGGFDAAIDACDATRRKVRCLFRAGDAFNASDVVLLAPGPGVGLVSRFGDGANPWVWGGAGFVALRDGWTVAHFSVYLEAPGSLFHLPAEVGHATAFDVRARNLRGPCVGTSSGDYPQHGDLIAIVQLDCKNVPSSDLSGFYLRGDRMLVMGNVVDSNYEGQFVVRTVHLRNSVLEHNHLLHPQDDEGNVRNVLQIRAWAEEIAGGPPPTKTEYVIVSDNFFSQDRGEMVVRTCQSNGCSDTPLAPGIENLIFERNFFAFSKRPGAEIPQMPRAFWLQGGAITVRNNVFDLQGILSEVSPAIDRLVDHAPNLPSAPTLYDDDIHVLGNVVYYDEPSPNPFEICGGGGIGLRHLCQNNLVYLPRNTGAKRIDDGGAWNSRNNLYAASNPFAAAVPDQGLTIADDFRISAGGVATDRGADLHALGAEVGLDFAERCRPGDGADADAVEQWDVGAFEAGAGTACLVTPEPGTVLLLGLGLAGLGAARPARAPN